jgi:UDP-N-acetylglucosamine acyltransferase
MMFYHIVVLNLNLPGSPPGARNLAVPQIHPTATIDPQARIADDVVIGPNCIIHGAVTIDVGTRLIAQNFLHGPMTLGEGNTLYPTVCLGYAPQDRKFDPNSDGAGLVIGARNVLREGVIIHRATGKKPTRVGDDNYFMSNTHMGHDAQLANKCTLTNGAMVGGHAEVQDNVVIGGNAAIHQFCRIGRLALLSGLAGVAQDVPPFFACYRFRCVGSLNIVGLRRAGYRQHIGPLKKAFQIFYHRGLSNPHAVQAIKEQLADDPLCIELADFIQNTRRGITAYGSGSMHQ